MIGGGKNSVSVLRENELMNCSTRSKPPASCANTEQGLIGGAPAAGLDAGAARHYSAIDDMPYQFDFYDGGGIDFAYLSAVEIDAQGSVNISRFANKLIGVGGFINISQNARKMVFGGTFTAGNLQGSCEGGTLQILNDGVGIAAGLL